MRQWCLPLLILAAAACSREPAPRVSASAPPPPPGAAVAQSAPAAAAAAEVTGVPVNKPVTAPAAALKAPRNDPRWRDVEPSEIAKDEAPKPDPALERFRAEQKRRDAELMAKDAEEAERQRAFAREGDAYDDGIAPRDDNRYAREGDRFREDPRYASRRASRERERAQAYEDDPYAREGDRYARPDEYPPQDEYDPYEDAPPPEEDQYEYPPEDDGAYDPRYDDPYRR